MQLNFLGEEFNDNQCKRMCDNCKRELQLVEKDYTHEAKLIIEIV
jgi:hypothetical protein